jgi:hypothetical protein
MIVAGCSQGITNKGIAAWRSLHGLNADDPNPKTAPFTGNMARAYHQPYPNLASVPPPPLVDSTTAERHTLAQTLIADRNATAALGGLPSPAAVAVPAPGAMTAAAAQPNPPTTAVAAPKPAPATMVAAATPAATTAAAMPQPAAKTASAGATKVATKAKPASHGATAPRPGQATAQQPLNSSLTMPTIPGPLPQPQTPQPPPAAPVFAAVPPVPAAPIMPPAAASSVVSQPPPPPPALPTIGALAAPAPVPAKRPPATIVATLDIAATRAADRAQIAHVAALYKERPRAVRVVAFAAAPAPGNDPLRLYDAALDRAQKIAKALAAAGIPAGRIETEANPASGRQLDRVDIQFAP